MRFVPVAISVSIVLTLALAVTVTGCERSSRTQPSRSGDLPPPLASAPPAAPAPAPPATSASAPALHPLSSAWLVELVDDQKKKIGVVSVPVGVTQSRPLMIALHGAGDRPEWACGEWRGVTDAYPFIVCPHGPGGPNAFFWSSPMDTRKHIERVVELTRAKFGVYVSTAPPVIAGFSMGATQAILLSRATPEAFSRLVAGEGGYPEIADGSFAPAYAKAGERALLFCTTQGTCGPTYRAAAQALARRGVSARVNLASTREHGIWDDVVRSLRRDWPWVVEGAPGWEGYAPAKDNEEPRGTTLSYEAEKRPPH